MLLSLSIQNYAIIDELEIDFKSGFSVVTGETGAGKSIIMGALGLVLGQRADSKSAKDKDKKCNIEACFDIAAYKLQDFFQENDLDYDQTTIIRREILPTGKSRSFINDSPASLTILKELGEQLIDIHSQHENLLLKDNSFQLMVVDTIAKNEKEQSNYHEAYANYKNIARDLSNLIEQSEKNNADKDYLQFQVSQLQEADLKADEQDSLEDELKQLTHAEEIKLELNKIQEIVSNETQGVEYQLKESIGAARRISKFLPEASDIEERLNSCYLEIKDLAQEIDSKQQSISHDPERIEYVSQRLDLIFTLQQKHHCANNEELLQLQEEFESKLNLIENSDEEIAQLRKKLDASLLESQDAANKLSITREKSAKTISKQMVQQLELLGMPKVRFEVAVNKKEELSSKGQDQVDFLFSANITSALQAVAQIASGGEIARVMLSIKSLMANSKALPSIIFDEIDTGISGDIADKMATIMQQMSTNMQVICITHLPQIASKGQHHFRVYKEKSNTNIKNLSTEERITEIASMLSGSALTEAAIANAKQLLSI